MRTWLSWLQTKSCLLRFRLILNTTYVLRFDWIRVSPVSDKLLLQKIQILCGNMERITSDRNVTTIIRKNNHTCDLFYSIIINNPYLLNLEDFFLSFDYFDSVKQEKQRRAEKIWLDIHKGETQIESNLLTETQRVGNKWISFSKT